MFGNNAFTRFQSQPAEDSAVSQKSPPKLGRGQKLNLKALCFHDKPHGRLVDSPQESAAPSLISDPLSFFSSSEKAATLDKNLLSSSWERSTSKKKRRRRRSGGGGVPICFHPSTKPFFLSVCCYSRDELIRQSFAAIIKARMAVQQLSVMLHLLNASSPPRTIAPVHGRALTRRRCQRCALTGSFIRLGFVICLNCDPYILALTPAPHVQINFALNAGGRNVAQNGLI